MPEPAFTWSSNGGMVAQVQPTGLSLFAFPQLAMLTGTLAARESSADFGLPAGQDLGPVLSMALVPLPAYSLPRCQVVHQHANAKVVYTYTFFDPGGPGVDCTIAVAVTNEGTKPIGTIALEGLTVAWGDQTIQSMFGVPSFGLSYLTAQGYNVMHPSTATPVGASWIITNQYALAINPVGLGFRHSFVYWGLWSGQPTTPTLYADCPCQPGQTATISWNIRIGFNNGSPDLWTYYLYPYQQQFQASFGGLQYTPNDRPVGMAVLGGLQCTPSNPYGFNTNGHAFDQPAQLQSWLAGNVPLMQAGGFQGCIFWQLGGTLDAGHGGIGFDYSPEPYALPAPVRANMPTLLSAFQAANLALGQEHRPAIVSLVSDYGKYARQVAISFADATLVAEAQERLTLTFNNNGTMLYYWDSFGDTLDSCQLAKALRETILGPNVSAFAEQATDLCLPWVGCYEEAATPGQDNYSIRGGSVSLAAIFRFLVPGCSIACRPTWQGDVGPSLDWFYRSHLTPILEDYQLGETGLMAALAQHNAMYFGAGNHW
jgi:hypothetical protein